MLGLKWLWANIEWGKLVLATLGTASPFVFKYTRKAYRRVVDVLAKLDTVHAQVEPNGGRSMNDEQKRQGAKIDTLGDSVLLIARRQRQMVKNADALQFEADAFGNWLLVTYKLAELCGLQPSDLHRRGWLEAVVEEDRDRVWMAWMKATREDLPFSSTFTLEHQDTRARVKVHARAEAWRNDAGAVLRYHGELELAH